MKLEQIILHNQNIYNYLLYFNVFFMKKLSLFSLLGLAGLLTFVATPTYAQESDYLYDDEFDYGVDEDGYDLETADNDYEVIGDYNWNMNSDDWISLGSTGVNVDLLSLIWGLSAIALAILGYCFFVYGSLFPISLREIYRKAGKKWWAFLVPFWWTMVYSEIGWMSKWLWLLPWLPTICVYLARVMPINVYSILIMVLSILALIWVIVVNYRVARRYGWNVFASILHAIIIFLPITILVLWLGNYKYQGKKESTVVEV